MTQSQLSKRSFWQRILRRQSEQAESQMPPIYTLKDAVALILVFFLCLLAIFQKMEILAILTLALIGAIIYKTRVRNTMDIGFELLRRARSAKVGDIELNVEQKIKDYSRLLNRQAEWIRVIVGDLSGEQISLLLAIYKADKYEARDKVNLRALRSHGLLFHNAPSLTSSTEVWLSKLGKEVACSLLESNRPDMVSENYNLVED